MQGGNKVGLLDLALDLRTECLVVRWHVGPLLQEGEKRVERMPYILHIQLSTWSARMIFQGLFMGLNILQSMLLEQVLQLAGHSRPVGSKVVS